MLRSWLIHSIISSMDVFMKISIVSLFALLGRHIKRMSGVGFIKKKNRVLGFLQTFFLKVKIGAL